MKRILPLIAASTLALVYASPAQARLVEYVSPHPVPHRFGDGFCYIDVPHTHNYPPGDPRMYRQVDNRFYFVGDPTPFGYDGPRFTYYGAHPVVDAEVAIGHPIYCYMKGPHVHWYAPPPQAHFQLSGGAYWYVGGFPPTYYDNRPRYAEINDAYAPVMYTRPVVDVQVAPPMFRADIAIGGPGFGARAIIGGPAAPVPAYAAPAPMVVAPVPVPAPVQVGVDIHLGGPAPAPVFIEPAPGVGGRWRHDRGRHEGWREPAPRFERHPPHGPPARYVPAPAPIRQPVWGRARPQGPTPTVMPAPRAYPRAPAGPVAAPPRGPAPPHGQAGPARGPTVPAPRFDRRPH